MAGPFNTKGTGWMAIPRELQPTSQCPNGSAPSSVPRGTLLGLILFNVIINDIVELSTPLASWLGTPSSAVQLTILVEGMPSLGTLIGLRSGPMSVNLIKFNMAKAKDLHTVWGNPQYRDRQGVNGLRATLWRTWRYCVELKGH